MGALTELGNWFLVLCLLIALPLVPAIIIYKTFPTSKSEVAGKFGAVSLNASGAFAAYIIVLAIFVFTPLSPKKLFQRADDFTKGNWFIEVEYELGEMLQAKLDARETEIEFGVVKDHRIVANPTEEYIDFHFKGKTKEHWPAVAISIEPGMGSARKLVFDLIKPEDLRRTSRGFEYAPPHVGRLNPQKYSGDRAEVSAIDSISGESL